MKRINVIFRGGLRGEPQELYRLMVESFNAVRWAGQENAEKRLLFCHWPDPKADEIFRLDTNGIFSSFEMKEPTKQECLDFLPMCCHQQRGTVLDETSRHNAFRMFYGNQVAMHVGEDADWTVYIRTECKTGVELARLDPNVWTSPDTNMNGGTCDMAGCANPRTARKAWSFSRDRLAVLFAESYNPEVCLSKLLADNGVRNEASRHWLAPELCGRRPH